MCNQPLKKAAFGLAMALGVSLGAQAEEVPKVLKSLESHGVEVEERFDAPEGLDGYVVSASGQLLTVFVTADKEHVLVGNLLDSKGNDLSSGPIQAAEKKRYAKAFEILEDSHWIADGSKNAERVVYTFTDANCPYCNRFWQQSQPWVEAGKVQVRHVMVGILRQDSGPKAAAMLGAKDPSKALHEHNTIFDNGGIKPTFNISADIQAQLDKNYEVMKKLGVSATPVTFYKEADGSVGVRQGLPPQQEMPIIMGTRKP